MYGNHDHCDESWCPYLKAKTENKLYVPKEGKEIFCKKKDKREYEQMVKAVERFQSDENIKECLHSYDTQYNESLNMSVARYVPKFKHFGSTMSLESRVRCVIGVHNSGYSNYYLTLLTFLGCISRTDDYRPLQIGIHRISNTKLRIGKYKQTKEYKRRRKHGVQAKNKQELYEEGVDCANNLGTYESGIAILNDDDEQQEQENTRQSSNLPAKSSGNKRTKRANPMTCSFCGLEGHKTNRSKACSFHEQYLEKQSQKKKSNATDQQNKSQNNEKNEKVNCVKNPMAETHTVANATTFPLDVVSVRNSTNNTKPVETIDVPTCEDTPMKHTTQVDNIDVLSTPVHEDVEIFQH